MQIFNLLNDVNMMMNLCPCLEWCTPNGPVTTSRTHIYFIIF